MAGKVLVVCKWLDFVCTGVGPDAFHPVADQDYSDLYDDMGVWAADKNVVPKPAPIKLGRVTNVTGVPGNHSVALDWNAPPAGTPTAYQSPLNRPRPFVDSAYHDSVSCGCFRRHRTH